MKSDLIIILYGSTGDLTFRKILPAIEELKIKNKLPENTKVVALGRRDFTTLEYIEFIKNKNDKLSLENIKSDLDYLKMEISKEEDYDILSKYLEDNKSEETNIIHYLALAANLVNDVIDNLSIKKIVVKKDLNHLLVFEKPFGDNYLDAYKINTKLDSHFSESQIYRVDHYLVKNIIDQIFNFKFYPNILNNFLNTNNIKEINVEVIEDVGILDRGPFYDKVGALKDMFQGHILQLLTIILSDVPKKNLSELIINNKVKVLKKLRVDYDSLVFGQYNGYLDEKSIEKDSVTETLFKGTLKYKNIKINIITGKKLDSKKTNLKLLLKDESEFLIDIHPNNSITLCSNILGEKINIKHDFVKELEDYSKLILAIIDKKKEFFVRRDEIEIAWKITEDILENKKELIIYQSDYSLE